MNPYASCLNDAFLAVAVLTLAVLVGTGLIVLGGAVLAACAAELFKRLKP